jgi:predicted permease
MPCKDWDTPGSEAPPVNRKPSRTVNGKLDATSMFMDTISRELTFALRGLLKNLGFTVVATITIALGIGACTAIFSVVNAVLLRPLPYTDAQRLTIVSGELRTRNVNDWPFSPPDFRDLRLQSASVFDEMAGLIPAGRTPIWETGAQPEQIRVGAATPNLFKTLGARILVGRDFIEDDATPQPPQGLQEQQAQQGHAAPLMRLPAIAIISHGLWQRRYGGNPAVVGKDINFGDGRAHIVGVLAPGFELLFPPRLNVERVPDMWTAARFNYETANRNNVAFRVIGRLKPGVTVDQAQIQVDHVAADLRQQFPIKQTSGLYFHVIPMFEYLVSGVRPAILSLMGAVTFVLLIACANVANLLVVRASARSRELAVRAAIGASRGQLVRRMLVESLLIAAVGTMLGLALARAGVRLLLVLGPKDLPRLDSVAIDPLVLTFASLAGLSTAALCGIVPAVRASRADVMEVLRSVGGRASGLGGGRRLRYGVVVTEVALSFILLVGAGLMLRSFVALGRVNPGYDPNHVLTFLLQAQLPQPAQRGAFKQQVRERLSAIPGIESVSAATPLPLDGQPISGRWGTEAAVTDPSTFRQANFHVVLPGYFETMRTPIVAGRPFTDADNTGIDQNTDKPKQIIIDVDLAARAFRGESAIGRRLFLRITTPEPEWYEVIGVAGHQRHSSLAEPGPEAIFIPDGHFGHGFASRWAVRTTGDPDQIATAVRTAISQLDPHAALAEVQPLQAFVDRAMAPIRFTTTLIGIFGAVAVLLAGIGLYGVLATIVRQRTAEIGMRMVFGAPPSSILNLVVGEALKLSAAGVAVGVVAAVMLTRAISSMLVGVSPTDPVTFAGIVALFVAISMLASWLPARRAAQLDPMRALREQ